MKNDQEVKPEKCELDSPLTPEQEQHYKEAQAYQAKVLKEVEQLSANENSGPVSDKMA